MGYLSVAVARAVKKSIPSETLKRVLLRYPGLYRLPMVRYESNLERVGLRDLYALADRIAPLPGAFLECGSSRCGSAILLAKRLKKQGRPRKIIALDSYAGFQRDELARERAAGLADCPDDAFTSTSLEYVLAKLHVLNLTDEIRPVKGYFQETLASVVAELESVAMAFIDCDLQESMRYCAQTIWPRLVSGGILAFDDYNVMSGWQEQLVGRSFEGSKLAVDRIVSDFRSEIADHGVMRRLYYVEKR